MAQRSSLHLQRELGLHMRHNHLARSLAFSQLAQASAAAAAIEQGWQVVEDSRVEPADGLASIYALRLEQLRSMPSKHARQLANSVEELVANLRERPECVGKWISVSCGAEHEFLIFWSVPSDEPLGCMRVVSQLDASPEQWSRLWSEI